MKLNIKSEYSIDSHSSPCKWYESRTLQQKPSPNNVKTIFSQAHEKKKKLRLTCSHALFVFTGILLCP